MSNWSFVTSLNFILATSLLISWIQFCVNRWKYESIHSIEMAHFLLLTHSILYFIWLNRIHWNEHRLCQILNDGHGYPSHRDCFPISIRTFNSWTSCLMAAQVKSWLIHNFCIFGRTIHYIETGLSCTNQIFHLIRKFSQCVLRAHNNTRDKYWVYIWLCQRLHGRRMKNIKKSE